METRGDDGPEEPGPTTTPAPSSDEAAPPPTPVATPPSSAPETFGGPAAGNGDARPPIGLAAGEWPAQAADTIVDLVGTVRDKTTGPVTKVARGAVFGLFLATVVTIVAVMALIALVRLLDEALPSGVWLPYLVLGVVFVAVGAIVYRRRRAVPA
jgi:hypothetical protein